MNKKEIRNKYKVIRSQIKHKGEKSHKIYSALTATEEYKKCKIIALYASLEDEADTSRIIDTAKNEGKTVLLPKIVGNGEMDFYETGDTLKENSFGIKEPNGTKKYPPEEIDFIIVPLICADKNRNRIGFGGGYYDRYLSNYKGDTIGICFDEQVSSVPLPCSKYDIKPNMIISDKRVIY